MQSGKLDKRVSFQTLVEAVDASGGITQTYTTQFTRWASVEPLNYGESFRYDQDLEVVTGLVMVRYDDTTKLINSSYRVLHNGKVLEVLSAINDGEQDKTIVINYRLMP